MIEFAEFCLLVLLGLLVVAVILVSVFFIYSTVFSGFMKRSPFIITTGATYKVMIPEMIAKIEECEKNSDMKTPFNIIDAGCGIATLLLPLAKKFPQHNFVGVEIGIIPYLIAKIRAGRYKNLQILRQDLFTTDFGKFNFIICFLLPKTMQELFRKCRNDIRSKTVFFVNRFKIDDLQPSKKIDIGDNFSYIYIYDYLPEKKEIINK